MLLRALVNLIRLLRLALGFPFRLARARRRPEYVSYRLAGDPPYRARRGAGWGLFRRRRPAGTVVSLEAFSRELEALAKDPGVRGVVLQFEGLEANAAKRQAMAGLLQKFRRAGKKVVAFAVSASTSEYGLMCAADTILLAPGGRLDLTGFAAEATAIGSGLKQLGVAAQFVRRGDYKTAPELFTRNQVSPIQRRTLEALLDERYAALSAAIQEGRRLSPDEARQRIDAGPYSARRALADKLCDRLCGEADLPDFLAGKTLPAERSPEPQKKSARLGTYAEYLSARPLPPHRLVPFRPGPRLSVVPIRGIIASGAGGALPVGPRVAGSDGVVEALRRCAKDRSRAVLLYVDSPGGSALASETVLEEVKRLGKKKPVLAYFDQVAASGGYMVALGAREIWAAPQAIAGSIGVFAGKFDLSGLLQKLGIYREVLTRGANAGIFSPSRPFSEREEQALEAEVEETYQAFLEHVANARKMTVEEVHRRAEGRIYSGAEALKVGLVDRTGGFEEACRHALELAGARTDRFAVSFVAAGTRRWSMGSAHTLFSRASIYALWLDGWLGVPEGL